MTRRKSLLAAIMIVAWMVPLVSSAMNGFSTHPTAGATWWYLPSHTPFPIGSTPLLSRKPQNPSSLQALLRLHSYAG